MKFLVFRFLNFHFFLFITKKITFEYKVHVWLTNLSHILTKLFHFFIQKKDTHFSKSFYNSLTAKNRFVIKYIRDSATLEEEKSPLQIAVRLLKSVNN